MRRAEILPDPAITPLNLELDAYIEQTLAYPMSGRKITFKAWIVNDGQAVNPVRETRLSDDQTLEQTDNGLILTTHVRESIELKWWILGMGERIRVLEPESLREEISRTLKAASHHYR